MKVTTPEDMSTDTDELVEIYVNKFESILKKLAKNENHYEVTIDGFISARIIDIIIKLYLNSGWAKVSCYMTFNKGTTLQLWRNE